jgi:hypothetical protein
MEITNTRNTDERKKLIVALVLGLVAIIFLWWTFVGFGGGSKPVNRNSALATPTPAARRAVVDPAQPQTATEMRDPLKQLAPIILPVVITGVPEPKRNIFAYYEKPPAPAPTVNLVTPTPTPTPPVLLATLSPANVFARTDDFTLEVSGDKFTPEVRVQVDGRELPTRFISPQQLSAVVPASLIANPGARQVTVKSSNGALYSNVMAINVSAPPIPNYTYVGIIGTRRYIDTALLQDKSNKEILNVQRGDVLGGRFRMTSISEKEVVLVDTNLKIKHSLPLVSDRDKSIGPQSRPTPRVDSEDDEP